MRRDDKEKFDIFIKNHFWFNVLATQKIVRASKINHSPKGESKKIKEAEEVVKLNEYKIGDEYAKVFASRLKKTDQKILHLNLRNNKLTDADAKAIIEDLTDCILTIDLSWNPKIELKAYEWLGTKIGSIFFQLKSLNLDNNNISKSGLETLWEGIMYNNWLSILSLNHNNFHNDHAAIIADLITNSRLKMLFLAWNKIRDKGGVLIFNALAANQTIQIFDISFNSLNSSSVHNYGNISSDVKFEADLNRSCQSASALNRMFLENCTLIHMDLSHNNFSAKDWIEISKGLNQNKSVLGLHMTGNSKDTNALGFINKKPSIDPALAHIHTRIHESLETWTLSK